MKVQDILDVDVADKEEVKKPSMYQVVLYNDDYTHAEFVVWVLNKFFGFDLQKAMSVMVAVHRSGKGIVGVYPKDVAESKVKASLDFAKEHEQPLKMAAEKVD